MVSITHSKQSSEIPVRCSQSSLDICHHSYCVFFLQAHIHHIPLVTAYLLSEEITCLPVLVVNFHLLHCISREVVQHNLLVAAKEVFAIKKEALHKLAIMVYASVTFNLNARHLAHQSVQHRPFCKNESVGVVHNGVTSIIELHLTPDHVHFLQHLRILLQANRR